MFIHSFVCSFISFQSTCYTQPCAQYYRTLGLFCPPRSYSSGQGQGCQGTLHRTQCGCLPRVGLQPQEPLKVFAVWFTVDFWSSLWQRDFSVSWIARYGEGQVHTLYPLTQAAGRSPLHSPFHSFIHLFTSFFTCSLSNLFTHLFTGLLTHLLTH